MDSAATESRVAARERLLAYQADPSNSADPWLQGRLHEIGRDLEGAAEQAAEKLFALGMSSDEVGEFLTATTAECDWMRPEDELDA